MNKFFGTGVALITPFNSDQTIDFEALKTIVNYNIDNGTNYLVISGTTGESVTITAQEKQEIINTVVAANNGRLPLILGIGGNNTAQVIAEIKATDLSKIDAILSVSPYYSKPTQEGIYQHFKAIAQATSKDIMLYNVPGRTSSNMSVETILRLANDFENIFAIKEAGGKMTQYHQLLKEKPSNFLVISGDDDLALPVVLAGGAGVVSVLGQGVPKQFTKMITLGLEGKVNEAYKLHYQLMPLAGLIFEENNPAGIKAVFEALNLAKDTVRLPLVEASEQSKQNIKAALKALD